MSTCLITRALTDRQRQLAAALGLHLLEHPVLTFTPQYTPEILAALLVRTPADAWVFTSSYASEAIASVYPLLPSRFCPPPIYTVGEATAAPLVRLGWTCHLPKIADSTHLARIVAIQEHRQPVHWCARDRRKEMSTGLLMLGIPLREYIIYEARYLPIAELPAGVAAIAVLSPRSGEQLPAELPAHIVLYAIGNTTQQALAQRYPRHTIICSPQASLESLLHTLAQNSTPICPSPHPLP